MTVVHDSTSTLSTSDGRTRPPAPPRSRDRLRLRRPAGGRFVDGGWWPHSLDLTVELPALVAAVEAAGYPEVRRVSYNLTGWINPPRRVTILNRVIKLGGYRTQDPATISLVDSSGWKRTDLVVIPPRTDPVTAEHAMAMAGSDDDPHRADDILAMAHETPAPRPYTSGQQADAVSVSSRESEGGRVPAT